MKKVFSTSMVNVLLALCAAVTSVGLARLFGPEIRGLYSVITSLVNTSVSVAVLGTPAYMARIVAGNESTALVGVFNHRYAITALIIISTLLAYLLATTMNWDAHLIDLDLTLIVLIAVHIPLSVISVLLLNLSLGQANWVGFNAGRLVFVIATLLGVMIYYFMGGKNLVGIVASLVFANFFTVAVQWFVAKPIHHSTGDWGSTVKRLYFGARYYALNSISNVSTGYLDFLVLSFLFDPVQVGYWAVARTLAALMSPVNHALSVVVFSGVMRNEMNAVGGFRAILRNFIFFNTFSVLFFLIFSEFIIDIVFGSEFSDSVPLVPMALGLALGSAVGELFEERLRGAGRPGPVNFSRFIPLVFLLSILVFHEYVTSVTVFSVVFAIGQGMRAIVAILIAHLQFTRQ